MTVATGQVSEIPGRETRTYIIIVGVNPHTYKVAAKCLCDLHL